MPQNDRVLLLTARACLWHNLCLRPDTFRNRHNPLVRGSSRTPQKSIWESHVSISASSFRMDADRQSDCDDRL